MEAVVVTHNSARDLSDLLECEPLMTAIERLIVVDNASTDGCAEIARRAGADVVARTANDGFAAAANAGIRRTTGPLFALLNPDIAFAERDLFDRLTPSFDDSAVAMVVPALRLRDGRLQDSVRRVPTPLDLVLRRVSSEHRERGALWSETPRDIPWAVGAFAVLRREAFEGVGGFDERYRLYFEDVDLCVRLRRAGWRLRFDPTVEVQHRHRGDSRASLTGWAMRQHIRSAARFFRSYPEYVVGGRSRLGRWDEQASSAMEEWT